MNKFICIGHLGKENDLKVTGNGTSVLSNSIAVKDSFKTQGEYKTTWVDIVIWGDKADNFARFTQKGSKVGIEGRMQKRDYENKQGQKVYVTEIVVDQFHLLDTKQANSGGQGNQQVNNQPTNQNSYNAPKNDGYNYNNDSRMLEAQQVSVASDDLPF